MYEDHERVKILVQNPSKPSFVKGGEPGDRLGSVFPTAHCLFEGESL